MISGSLFSSSLFNSLDFYSPNSGVKIHFWLWFLCCVIHVPLMAFGILFPSSSKNRIYICPNLMPPLLLTKWCSTCHLAPLPLTSGPDWMPLKFTEWLQALHLLSCPLDPSTVPLSVEASFSVEIPIFQMWKRRKTSCAEFLPSPLSTFLFLFR